MRIHANRDAPKRLGESALEAIASGDVVHVLYIALRELTAAGHGHLGASKIEALLEASTRVPRSAVFYMPSGDLFMLAREYPAEALRQITNLIAAHLSDQVSGNDVSALCHIYELPEDAIPLRKLIKAYLADGTAPRELPAAGGRPLGPLAEPTAARDHPVEVEAGAPERSTPAAAGGRGGAAAPPSPAPEPPARPGAGAALGFEGPLTLDLLDRLQQLLDHIDLTPFVHQQPVFSREGSWHACYVEHFFDLTRLSQTYFPRVDLRSNEGLFVQFTRNLDDLMLIQILSRRAARRGRIGINLTVGTVRSTAFLKISEHFSAEERRNIVCELHWTEFLQDVQDGGTALQHLSQQGYGIALDRISPLVLPYLQLSSSWLDFIKVPFDRAALARIGPDSVAALKACDPHKLVLTMCDDAKALALGEALGIRNFQGRLIDRMVDRAA